MARRRQREREGGGAAKVREKWGRGGFHANKAQNRHKVLSARQNARSAPLKQNPFKK